MSYSAAHARRKSSNDSQAKEKELCGIDFYGVAVASYPKTWSAR